MTTTAINVRTHRLHPLQAVLLGGMLTLFAAAALSDYAYSSSYAIQWGNFAAWLNFGGLLFCGVSMLWAAIDLLRGRQGWLFVALLLASFLLGLVGALVHTRDAFGTMPEALILSLIVTLLAGAAVWLGLAETRRGVVA